MQRTHRRRHRLMWLVIVPVIAAAIFFSVRSRPEFPVEPQTPPAER